MKKYLLSILFAMFGIVTYAQTEPAITLTVEIDGNARNLVFAMTETGHKLQIDWGDGKLVETEEIAVADEYGATTTVTGTPTGEGIIKIYGNGITVFGCDSHLEGAHVTAINTSAATDLKELNVYTNALKTLDLSQNTKLEKLNCYNNDLETLDLTANKKLTRLDAKDTPLAKIDLTQNKELSYLSLNNCPIEAIDLLNCKLANIDLSKNTALTYVNLNNNQLTSLDVTASEALGTLFCMGNQLTELKADNVTKSVNCSKNNFTLATLPALPCKTYTYAPQNALQIMKRIWQGEKIDLSAQDNLTGLTTEAQKTTFVWKTGDTELQAGTDYTMENDVFTFLKAFDEPVYCEMTTEAFPKFSGTNTFKTAQTTIETEPELYLTLTADVDGNERNLTFASTTEANRIMVDWGNGQRMTTDTIALADEYGTTTPVIGRHRLERTERVYQRTEDFGPQPKREFGKTELLQQRLGNARPHGQYEIDPLGCQRHALDPNKLNSKYGIGLLVAQQLPDRSHRLVEQHETVEPVPAELQTHRHRPEQKHGSYLCQPEQQPTHFVGCDGKRGFRHLVLHGQQIDGTQSRQRDQKRELQQEQLHVGYPSRTALQDIHLCPAKRLADCSGSKSGRNRRPLGTKPYYRTGREPTNDHLHVDDRGRHGTRSRN